MKKKPRHILITTDWGSGQSAGEFRVEHLSDENEVLAVIHRLGDMGPEPWISMENCDDPPRNVAVRAYKILCPAGDKLLHLRVSSKEHKPEVFECGSAKKFFALRVRL